MQRRVDEFRGVLADSCWWMAELSGTCTITDRGEMGRAADVDLRPARNVSPERLEAAGRLYATFRVLQTEDGGGIDGGITTAASSDAGALPAVAVVAIVAVGAVAVGYCAHQASYVVDRQLSRREDSRRLLHTHEIAVQAIEAHVAREKAAGKRLPLDPATKSVLGNLRGVQEQIISRDEQPFEPFIPRTVSTGAGWAIGTTPLLIAGGVLAYFILSK